jgi:hypothetical protein
VHAVDDPNAEDEMSQFDEAPALRLVKRRRGDHRGAELGEAGQGDGERRQPGL